MRSLILVPCVGFGMPAQAQWPTGICSNLLAANIARHNLLAE